eukprot:1625317-Pleurochrysis_carterae.AAC.2
MLSNKCVRARLNASGTCDLASQGDRVKPVLLFALAKATVVDVQRAVLQQLLPKGVLLCVAQIQSEIWAKDAREALCAHLFEHANKLTARYSLYTDKAKPLKEPRTPKAEHELRQQGARRRDRDFGADCLERRSGN